ncbi:MAG: chemotaxis response regulator protein-glutamate methylesterase [Gammaproteobacteria bacterium]|nr:chemotaxis response regulator protein-glutamate methylesterase [Gammaproteobacteria bacterium]MDH5652166.1 chemotaxis response regulator protein-glutamate methylesterase [Gammaproteobacteria bacterium]
MSIKVLVVDDSGFFRRRVGEMINADPLLEVIGYANDGKEAIELNKQLKPDVITMDIEMPVMDGIEATHRIMAEHPTQIIMFSSLTTEGATSTLEALEAGAVDFLPKRFQDIAKDIDEARMLLCQRVRALGGKPAARKPAVTTARPAADKSAARAAVAPRPAPPAEKTLAIPTPPADAPRGGKIKLVAIGTSTGGPVALQNVLTKLPGDFPLPILLIQHMPATFTPTFAERLNQQCAISVKEAADGDLLKPGLALLAPGGMQMQLTGTRDNPVVKIVQGEASQTYKPSVDITFTSIAGVFPGETLAVIMTGMGADGREGARVLKGYGSKIWAQNEESCVVYGMPAAIVDAGLADKVLHLDEIGKCIVSKI